MTPEYIAILFLVGINVIVLGILIGIVIGTYLGNKWSKEEGK